MASCFAIFAISFFALPAVCCFCRCLDLPYSGHSRIRIRPESTTETATEALQQVCGPFIELLKVVLLVVQTDPGRCDADPMSLALLCRRSHLSLYCDLVPAMIEAEQRVGVFRNVHVNPTANKQEDVVRNNNNNSLVQKVTRRSSNVLNRRMKKSSDTRLVSLCPNKGSVLAVRELLRNGVYHSTQNFMENPTANSKNA